MMMMAWSLNEHPQVAAHENDGQDDGSAGEQAEARCNIHNPHPTRDGEPSAMAL